MGLFNFLDMDAPQVDIPDKKRGPAGTVWHLYTSKLSKNIATNIIFLVCNIPSIIIAYIGSVFALPMINSNLSTTGLQEIIASIGLRISDQATPGTDITMQVFMMIVVFVSLFLVGMNLISVGPIQTGLVSIYRNYARRKPVMLWSDFVSTVKKEWKQSLAASIITLILAAIIVSNIAFYNTMNNGTFSEVLLSIFVVLFVFLMCIQLYVYPMIASVNLKLLQVFRNSAILFIARFPQTVGIFLLNVLILGVIPAIMLFSFSSIGMVLALLYYGLFAFSFTHLMNTVFVWKQIERFMVREESTDEKDEEVLTTSELSAESGLKDDSSADESNNMDNTCDTKDSSDSVDLGDSGDTGDAGDPGDTGDAGDSGDNGDSGDTN